MLQLSESRLKIIYMKTKRGALKAIENSYQLPGGLVVSSCLLICEVVINEFSSLRSFKGFKPLEQSMGISVLIVRFVHREAEHDEVHTENRRKILMFTRSFV